MSSRLEASIFGSTRVGRDAHGDPVNLITTPMTIRELACMILRLPESGNAELDKMIEGARQADLEARIRAASDPRAEAARQEFAEALKNPKKGRKNT